jgi:DNA-binding NarL/FixJ family response regulator
VTFAVQIARSFGAEVRACAVRGTSEEALRAREIEVLGSVARGLSNRAIAGRCTSARPR